MLTEKYISERRSYYRHLKDIGAFVGDIKKLESTAVSRDYRKDFRETVLRLFVEAMEANDKEKLEKFFKEPGMFDISATYEGQSLLYNAMLNESYNAMEVLVNNGAELGKGELNKFKFKLDKEDIARDRYTVKLLELLQKIKASEEPMLNPILYARELLRKSALGEEKYSDRYNIIHLTTYDGKDIDFDLVEVMGLTSKEEVNNHIFNVLFKKLAPKDVNVEKLGYLQDKLSSEQSLRALASGYITFADLEKMIGDITDQTEIDRRFDFLTSTETLAMLATKVVSIDEIISNGLYSRSDVIKAKELDSWEEMVTPGSIDETKHTWQEILAHLMQVISDMIYKIPHRFTSAYHHVMEDKPKVKHLEEASKHVDNVEKSNAPLER